MDKREDCYLPADLSRMRNSFFFNIVGAYLEKETTIMLRSQEEERVSVSDTKTSERSSIESRSTKFIKSRLIGSFSDALSPDKIVE